MVSSSLISVIARPKCISNQHAPASTPQESDFRHLVLSVWGGQSCLYHQSPTPPSPPQESDFRHLVLSVWGGQSCLSADPDLYELLLCRWDVSQPWAPWNCVLLTRDETEAHYKLGKPHQVRSWCRWLAGSDGDTKY